MPAELTVAQMKALHWAASVILNGAWSPREFAALLASCNPNLRRPPSRRWRENLREANGEVSRELATSMFTKGGKRA